MVWLRCGLVEDDDTDGHVDNICAFVAPGRVVLQTVTDEANPNYEPSQDNLRRLRDAGLDDVGDASVYGTLRRLFQSGALTSYVVPSEEGPHRKYYAVNDAGRAQLAASTGTWRSFTNAMDKLLGAGGEEAA